MYVISAFKNIPRARALAKHGDKAEVLNKATVKCHYQSCQKKITCRARSSISKISTGI